MGRRQIEKDFTRLYVGRNTKSLVESYYRKKKRDMLLIFLAGLVFLFLILLSEWKSMEIKDGNTLWRNSYGEGEEEVKLELKRAEGEWEEVVVRIGERVYSETQLEEAAEKLAQELPKRILKENIDVDHIRSNLDLMEEAEGYPFLIYWTSSEPSVIDRMGRVDGAGLDEEGQIVGLTAVLKQGDWEKEIHFFVRVLSPIKEGENTVTNRILERVEEMDEENRMQEFFQLPLSFEGSSLQWRYPMEKEAFAAALCLPLLMAVLWREKDREVTKEVQKRAEALQNRYPEFVGKLTLYMEAGMPAKGALFRIAEDYRRKKENGYSKDYLYEELQYVCFQMQNGMGEIRGYELLGIRCELPSYRKLAALLQSHTEKGLGTILESLREESRKANEEKRNLVKRKGEEAGTKLLFPMILLLGIVMVLILVPAVFTFQI